MNTRDTIELVTLATGIIVSVYGAIKQIRDRRAGDAALASTAGAEALAQAKAAQDVAIAPSFLDQVRDMAAQLAEAQARLAAAGGASRQPGVVNQPPGGTQGGAQ